MLTAVAPDEVPMVLGSLQAPDKQMVCITRLPSDVYHLGMQLDAESL